MEHRAPAVSEAEELLTALFREQLARRPADRYLPEHIDPHSIRTHLDVFRWYLPHLPPHGDVLDWGCRHAPDACLLRCTRGDAYRLFGCDFAAPSEYAVFHRFAGLEYRQLADPLRLPYPDASFDAVISSGTLEHAALDYESLKELYRALRSDGVLVVTYVPNRSSPAEWYRRRVQGKGFHRRLYRLEELTTLLSRAGFYTTVAGYQTHLDRLPPVTWRHRLLRGLCWLAPLHRLTSTLCAIGVKVFSM